MACYSPSIRCFDYNDYGHIAADCQTKSPHQAYQQDTEIPTLTQDHVIDPHLRITIEIGTITVTIETGIGLAGPDPIHAVIDKEVTVTMSHKEVILGPITNPHATAHHITEAQAHTATDEIPHTADLCHAEVFPQITVGPDHAHHTNTTTKHLQDHLTAPTKQPRKPRKGNISRSPLMIHHLSTIALMSKPMNQMKI